MTNATVMIIMAGGRNSGESLTLRQCGFKAGDLVEVEGFFNDGSVCCRAIRNTKDIRIGDTISLETSEFVVVEGEV